MRITKILYGRGDLSRLGVYLSNTTLLRLEASGKFPRRIYMSPHAVAWVADEVDQHLSSLASQRGAAS